MTNVTTNADSFEPATDTAAHLFDNWFDPIEAGVRERIREFIETMIESELETALARPRYGRRKAVGRRVSSVVEQRFCKPALAVRPYFGYIKTSDFIRGIEGRRQ